MHRQVPQQGLVYSGHGTIVSMQQNPVRPKAEVLALQMNAERAGLAWACPFSSSDEFEAAVISAKRRAGAYGPKRLHRPILYAIVVVCAAAAAFLLV